MDSTLRSQAVIGVPAARHVQDRCPVATHGPSRPPTEAPTYLSVQMVTLPVVHRDVAREGVQHLDVALDVVDPLPVEVPNMDALEQPAGLDLVPPLRELAGPQPLGAGRDALTDLVVDVLDLGEERVPAVWPHMLGVPEGEVAARRQGLPGPRVADRRVDPVPGGGGVHEVEPGPGRGPPVLEASLDHLPLAAREVPASGRSEMRPRLHAGDPEPAPSQGQGRLASGATH